MGGNGWKWRTENKGKIKDGGGKTSEEKGVKKREVRRRGVGKRRRQESRMKQVGER